MKILLLPQPQSFQGNQATVELQSGVTDTSGTAALVSHSAEVAFVVSHLTGRAKTAPALVPTGDMNEDCDCNVL